MKKFISQIIIFAIISLLILICFDYIDVFSSFDTNYIEEISGHRYSEKQIVEKLFSSYIQKKANEEVGRFRDFKIDSIDVVNFDNPKDIDNDAKDADIFAVVTYSVKPTLKSKSNWLTGNGEVKGFWIVKKTNCLWIQENDGKYMIKGEYTGW